MRSFDHGSRLRWSQLRILPNGASSRGSYEREPILRIISIGS